MTSPSSLRGLYIDPSNAWAFVPPSPNAPKPNATSVSPPEPVGQAYQFSTRPTRNSIFELSPSLDLDEHSGINTAQLFKTVVASAVLQYTSSALVNPWEVGKLLLQVQWVPRDAGEPQAEEEYVEEEAEETFSDSENDESYFADPHAATAPRRYPAPRPTDEQGYVIRRSVLEEGTRPEYILPVGCVDGVWNMIKRIGRFRFEGWLALWKGLATSTLTEMAYTSMQPLANQFLQSLFLPSMSPFHQPPLFLTVASHVVAGFFLSPLDLIRTRLVVQSFTSRYRTYTGPFNALHKILRDEGGLRGIYFHPNLLIPTLLDSALRPIVSLALPGIIASYFGASHITEATHPVAWGCAELASSCIGLLITLPIETIRRRLQVQVRGSAEPMKGCVELRPAPYNGVVDAFWHILTEERSDLPITHRPRRRQNSKSAKSKDGDKEEKEDTYDDEPESIWKNTGLGQLYHGLGMRLGASAIYFVLNLFVSPEEADAGWVEI